MRKSLWLAGGYRKIKPAPVLLRWFGPVIPLLIAVAGCWVIVRLLVGFTSPMPVPHKVLLESPILVAEKFLPGSLFGAASNSAPPEPQAAVQDFRLLGVLSSNQLAGARAIVRQDGGDKTWVLTVGDELQNGTKVIKIEPGQITLSRMGQESILALTVIPPISSKSVKN